MTVTHGVYIAPNLEDHITESWVEWFSLSDGRRMASDLTKLLHEGAEFLSILPAADDRHCIVILAVDVPDN